MTGAGARRSTCAAEGAGAVSRRRAGTDRRPHGDTRVGRSRPGHAAARRGAADQELGCVCGRRTPDPRAAAGRRRTRGTRGVRAGDRTPAAGRLPPLPRRLQRRVRRRLALVPGADARGRACGRRRHHVGGFREEWHFSLPQSRACDAGRIPAALVWVMNDPFGNAICLGLSGPHRGRVYFWDHENEPDDDGDGAVESAGHLQRLANSFTGFVAGLRPAGDGCAEPPRRRRLAQEDGGSGEAFWVCRPLGPSVDRCTGAAARAGDWSALRRHLAFMGRSYRVADAGVDNAPKQAPPEQPATPAPAAERRHPTKRARR